MVKFHFRHSPHNLGHLAMVLGSYSLTKPHLPDQSAIPGENSEETTFIVVSRREVVRSTYNLSH